MTPRLWNCKELALVAAIVALAFVAAFLSIKLTRPNPFARATSGVEWQCNRSLPFTTCHRVAHARPASLQGKPVCLTAGVRGGAFFQPACEARRSSAA
jgi:hypothetical protein